MGFYSTGAYNITIDGNDFYDNILFAIDPPTSTHNMIVLNKKIYNNNKVLLSYVYWTAMILSTNEMKYTITSDQA